MVQAIDYNLLTCQIFKGRLSQSRESIEKRLRLLHQPICRLGEMEAHGLIKRIVPNASQEHYERLIYVKTLLDNTWTYYTLKPYPACQKLFIQFKNTEPF